MATVTPTVSNYASEADESIKVVSWAITTANLDGAPVEMAEWADRCVQANGTWGGATLQWQGSNDNLNWFTLSSAAGATAITLTADGLRQVIELPRYMRPFLSVAGAGATITVTLILRRANPMRA